MYIDVTTTTTTTTTTTRPYKSLALLGDEVPELHLELAGAAPVRHGPAVCIHT